MTTESRVAGVAKGLHSSLARHGYGFQYAVTKMAADLSRADRSPWILPVLEFPVEVRGSGTRIDIIFQHKVANALLVCECKRVNPAYSDWCFVRQPKFIDGLIDRISYEILIKTSEGDVLSSLSDPMGESQVYHLAQEVRSSEKGDSKGQGKGMIEEAATQVLRGTNGLARFFHERPEYMPAKNLYGDRGEVRLIPVIFTTARLWTSQIDLSESELASGILKKKDRELMEVDYLYYVYHQSPGLKHDVPQKETGSSMKDLSDALRQEYTRAITIVGASGAERFFVDFKRRIPY